MGFGASTESSKEKEKENKVEEKQHQEQKKEVSAKKAEEETTQKSEKEVAQKAREQDTEEITEDKDEETQGEAKQQQVEQQPEVVSDKKEKEEMIEERKDEPFHWRWSKPAGKTKGSFRIALNKGECRALQHLLAHYPRVVYVGVTFWRKMLIFAHRHHWGPSMAQFDELLLPFSEVSTNAKQLGCVGDLRRFCSPAYGLHRKFLQVRIPLSNANARRLQNDDCEESEKDQCPCPEYGRNFFQQAILANQVDCVVVAIKELQLSLSEDLNQKRTALHLSCFTECDLAQPGYQTLVKLLLESGASVAALDQMSETPLHTAAEHGLTEGAELLLQRKADPNAEDQDGDVPMDKAMLHGHTAIVKLLAENGADVTHRNERSGSTLLHRAATHDQADILSFLLGIKDPRTGKLKCDLNAQGTGDLWTALHCAAWNFGPKSMCFDLLVLKGAQM